MGESSSARSQLPILVLGGPVNIPGISVNNAAVKIWLSKMKKKYSDDWKVVVYKAIYEDGVQSNDIHPEVKKHLNRKKP